MNPSLLKGRYSRMIYKYTAMARFWQERFDEAISSENYFSAGVAKARLCQIEECLKWAEKIYVQGVKI